MSSIGPSDYTYRAALERAAVICGGIEPLRSRLQVSMTDLSGWLAGTDRPTLQVILRVIDVLLEESSGPVILTHDRASSNPPRTDN